MTKMRWNKLKVFCAAAALAMAGVAAPAPAIAQVQCDDEGGGPSKTLNPRIATVLQEVFDMMQAEQYQEALARLNELIANRGGSMAAFDRATSYELRGSVKASLEDFRGAQRDFQTALDLNQLPAARNNQLRYFIAQIHFQLEDFQSAIRGLNAWIERARACDQPVDANAYYLLAAAYIQAQPPNFRAALRPAEQAKAASTEPRKSHYDLLNLIYSELDDVNKRIPLLEEMVNLWPGDKGYWTQLSGAYNITGRDKDAFAVLEVAYRAGLLTSESEMKTLIQYYSFFNNPFRGAKLMEREMNAGTIKRTQDNLVLLSQLWSQAREHKRSIPILREAAGQSSTGKLSYQLGMVLLADEQYAPSARALESALNKGGMTRKDTGDAWLLLGTARFSQAGPEDTEVWASARRAFVNAQRYEGARRRATEWIAYIDAVADTYRRAKELERRQEIERCQADIERIETQRRIRELRVQPATAEELAQEQEIIDRCAPFIEEGIVAAPSG